MRDAQRTTRMGGMQQCELNGAVNLRFIIPVKAGIQLF